MRPDEKKNRYHLPNGLDSASPVGYRRRVSMSQDEAEQAVKLLSLGRPEGFVADAELPTEGELFEEASLGVMTSRQSTNYRGHRQTTLGPSDSARLADELHRLTGLEAPVLDDATHTHLVFSRPYRTPFTLLLTFIGHKPLGSLLTVPLRAIEKKLLHRDDIPTIGYLQQLHVGVLADAMERAAAIASGGRRRAQVHMAPFLGKALEENRAQIRAIETRFGSLTAADRRAGWRLALVAQVGQVDDDELGIEEPTYRKIGANLMACRSERIQPGVNQEDKAPSVYQNRQDMVVPEELRIQSGRACYNAFAHWTGIDRERCKELMLLDRVDVLTEGGKHKLRAIRGELADVTDKIIDGLPLWADLVSGFALSRNAKRGKKAFALAGQRIYVGGLDRAEVAAAGLDWQRAVRAVGAGAARGALYAEMMGCTEVPDSCDLLAGICLMAGPVNQNDIGKQFFGSEDLLCHAFPDKDPTSLLVWTLKAKTVADPVGNEEQLLNEGQKGALVDLRPGPHEVVQLKKGARFEPMRRRGGQLNRERAFGEVGNFVGDPDGRDIPGNQGARWPAKWRERSVWEG